MEIKHNNINLVGTFKFQHFSPSTRATFDEFNIILNTEVRLSPLQSASQKQTIVPMIIGLRGTMTFNNGDGRSIEIGQLSTRQIIRGTSVSQEFGTIVEWRGTTAALVAYEKQRNGGPVKINANMTGELYLLKEQPNHRDFTLDDAPCTFAGEEPLDIKSEDWADIIRTIGIVDLILLQIPFPTTTNAQMAPVYASLQQARDDFTTGGSTGWTTAGMKVRQALNDWETAVTLDTGKGLDPKDRTKDQRLDQLRQSLREFANLSSHSEPQKATWTREDALLSLSATIALLNATKP